MPSAASEQLPKRTESFGQRPLFRSMAGIDNATNFLLVFRRSSPQIGFTDAGTCLEHRDLGNLWFDRYGNQAPALYFPGTARSRRGYVNR
jgi:hypothetical protein